MPTLHNQPSLLPRVKEWPPQVEFYHGSIGVRLAADKCTLFPVYILVGTGSSARTRGWTRCPCVSSTALVCSLLNSTQDCLF